MADDSVVLCDALCFIVNKYGKVNESTLKSVLTDFYDVECLSKAKLRLIEDIDKLNLSTKRPHVALRRDGDGRLAKEVSDILTLLQFVDEHSLSSKLPTYVATSPDTMPSLRLYDGDMKMIVKMLQDMRDNLFEYGSAVAAICTEIKGLQQVVKDLSHIDRQPRSRPTPVVAKAAETNQLGAMGVAFQSAGETSAARPMPMASESESETVRTSAYDWAAAASTPRPHGSRFSVLSIDNDDNDRDDEFVTVDRRKRKRVRQHTSPQENKLHQSRNPNSTQTQAQQQQQQPSTGQQNNSRATLVGKAAVVCNIKAAERIRKKQFSVLIMLMNLAPYQTSVYLLKVWVLKHRLASK